MQTAVEIEHHLIVTREVINKGSDRSHLAMMARDILAIDEF